MKNILRLRKWSIFFKNDIIQIKMEGGGMKKYSTDRGP